MKNSLENINIGDIINMDKNTYVKDEPSKFGEIEYDSDWFDLRFLPPDTHMHPYEVINRYYSTANRKMTSTGLGRSYAINPAPQFGRNADIRHGNRSFGIQKASDAVGWSNRHGDNGYGRGFSEVIDDAQQLVMVQYGKEKFNSIPNFVFSAIDSRDSYIARTGRYPTAHGIGYAIGSFSMLVLFPKITAIIWLTKTASKIVFGTDNFNYYYMEPTMHLYWGAVNQLVTVAATELGILIPEVSKDDKDVVNKVGMPYKMNQSDFKLYSKYLPGLISENGYIDVFAIATGAQTLANRVRIAEYEYYSKMDEEQKGNPINYMGYVFKGNDDEDSLTSRPTEISRIGDNPVMDPSKGIINKLNYYLSFTNFLNKLTKGGGLFASEDVNESDQKAQGTATLNALMEDSKNEFLWNGYTKDAEGRETVIQPNKSFLDKLAEATDAAIKEGGGYAIYRVDYVGSSTENFSNTVGKIDTGSAINSLASTARNIRFNIMDANTGVKLVDDAKEAIKGFINGAVEGLAFGADGVVEAIFGNSFVDVPDKWESSDMSFTSHTYTMKLRSLYNTPFSILKDEIIPTIMVLCGILPLSTGQSSHGSPFICEFFSKGITHINPGIFTNVTITRGVSNLGMDLNKRSRGIDITFQVADLNNIMTAPVNASIFSSFQVALEDNKPINNYIATIASRDLLTSKYAIPKIKLRLSRLLMNAEQAVSPTAMGLRMGSMLNGILGGLVADHSMASSELNIFQ